MFNQFDRSDNKIVEAAKNRKENNPYMGTVGSRRFQKANDEWVLRNTK